MTETGISTRVLSGFDDPTFGPEQWEKLLADSNTDIVYLTWHWQQTWWKLHPRIQLMLIIAENNGQVVALAPFYAESGMIFFVGTGFESGYLDFIGDIGNPDVLDALLETARANVSDFSGFRFYFVPDSSSTGKHLAAAAERLGFKCYDEGETAGPVLDLASEAALAAVNKKRRTTDYERILRRDGSLEIEHMRDGRVIQPHLDEFFTQHMSRWAAKGHPSVFANQKQRTFIEQLTLVAANTGWLRFTRATWNGRPIAFHYGFCYRGRYFYEVPSFEIGFARYSPGLVLLRNLLLAAMAEGAHTFDFGIGDQEYKYKFVTHVNRARTFGLYPSG